MIQSQCSSSCQHFIIHLSLQIARFLQATFVQPLLLEGLKSVNLSCKTAVKKTKGKYENGWITKARSTTNFWLSENYFPQNLWSRCEAQSDLCVWWFNVDIFQFQKLQWPWIRRPPGKWWIFAAKRLSVRVAAGGIKVSDTGISVHLTLATQCNFLHCQFLPFLCQNHNYCLAIVQYVPKSNVPISRYAAAAAATGCWLSG